MIRRISDWCFDVDVDATLAHTKKNAADHCTCGYCKNYYESVARIYPQLIAFLEGFGVDFNGPSELMPFEPTYLLACYRVHGRVVTWGNRTLTIAGIPVTVELAEKGTFFLWVGEMELPWLQEEDMDEVVSPANLPEFLDRMEAVWILRHGDNLTFS